MQFFRDVISKLINAEFQGHTSFKVADNKAVGDNPVRELHLDAVPVNDDQSIVSLAWDGGNKLFEKTLPSEEAKHNFELISSDMSEAVSLTSNGKIDEAKKLMESLVNKYSEQSGERVPTNLPPVTTTQAALEEEWAVEYFPNDSDKMKIHKGFTSKEQAEKWVKSHNIEDRGTDIDVYKVSSKDFNIFKIAKVNLRNIFPSGTIQDLTFDTQEELSSYQEKMKQLNPQDQIPLWDINKGKAPEGEESTEIAPPSLSYDQIEKEKEKEHKNLEKSIDEKIKTEVESALIEKAATVFGPDQIELVKVLRKNGRNWDEIKKILVKDFNFDKEATTIFVDDLRSKEEGTPVGEPIPEAPKPPENLVSPETHDKLLEDLDKPVDEKKSEPPVKEEKEPTFTPKDIMDIPEEKESSKKCPKCNEDVWDVSTVDQRLNKCWNCGTRFDNPEMEEIARADNAEIRKVAADNQQFSGVPTNVRNELKTEIEHSFYRQNAPGSTSYRFSLDGNKIYRGEYIGDLEWDNDDFGPYQFMYNFEMKAYKENLAYKPTAFASLNKKALNPLQEPPVVEQPTAETSNQDIVPISQTPDHDTPAKGDRVFVMSDLGDEKAGFEGTYVSEYTSKGNQYAIIETDEKDLLDVEMHRVSKVSENTSPEPSIEPNVQKPEEPDIEVTPKMEDLHSSQDALLEIQAEVKNLEAQLNEMGKISFKFIKKGLEKHADDSAFEGNGWCRVWVQEDEIAVDSKYPEVLKIADESSRIKALKEIARDIAHEALRDADNAANKFGVQAWFDVLKPSDHDRIDWVALANPQQENVESSLKQAKHVTKCVKPGCTTEMELKDMVENVHGAGYLCKEHAAEWNKDASLKVKAVAKCEKCDEPLKEGKGPRCAHCVKAKPFVPPMTEHDLSKKAADPVPAKTEYKELKKAPDYVDPKSAVPASPDMEQVLVKMESLQNKLSVLDQAKEKIKMAMQEELKKIDVGGERSQIEKELQDSYEKLGILIDATESKVINWSEQLYTLQHQEKEIVPQPTTGELLAKIYAKFEGSERFVDSVLNGFKALAKKVQTKRLVQWPDKRSSIDQPMEKEASVMDDLNQLNEEMLKALQALS